MPVAQGGKSAVCLGEPIGSPDSRAELAWRFLEYCGKNDYEISISTTCPRKTSRSIWTWDSA